MLFPISFLTKDYFFQIKPVFKKLTVCFFGQHPSQPHIKPLSMGFFHKTQISSFFHSLQLSHWLFPQEGHGGIKLFENVFQFGTCGWCFEDESRLRKGNRAWKSQNQMKLCTRHSTSESSPIPNEFLSIAMNVDFLRLSWKVVYFSCILYIFSTKEWETMMSKEKKSRSLKHFPRSMNNENYNRWKSAAMSNVDQMQSLILEF